MRAADSAHQPLAGFTLVEMAIVMVVIGLVMLTVFPALNAVRLANQRTLTQGNLRSLMLATAAYVQANGCLPCPANAGGVGASFGVGAACGACATTQGIAPFVTLGLPASTARDGWGHWISMRIDPALSAKFAVVPPFAPCAAGDRDASGNACAAGSAAKGLCSVNLSAKNTFVSVTTPGGATQKAAVIFISHGADGYGSYFAQPTLNGSNGAQLPFPSSYAACSAFGGYARCNAAQTAQFDDAPPTIGGGNDYDDQLAYADRNALIAMLGVGACQTVW